MLLYKFVQWVVMNKRLNGEELMVKVQDQFMYTGKNPMGDMREPYRMVVTCLAGGPNNILRYAGTLAGDDVPVPVDAELQWPRVMRSKSQLIRELMWSTILMMMRMPLRVKQSMEAVVLRRVNFFNFWFLKKK